MEANGADADSQNNKETRIDTGEIDYGDDSGGGGGAGEDTAGGPGGGVQADGAGIDGQTGADQVAVVSVPVELVDSWNQELVVVNTSLVVLIVAVFVCAGALCVQTLLRSFRW